MRLWVVPCLLVASLAVAGPAFADEEEACVEDCAPRCPTDLVGTAPQTGGVFMSWTVNAPADVNVYRAVGDGAFVFLERLEFPATRYIDLDTEPGGTYRYQVTAVAEEESEACGSIEVTTVPDLGSIVAVGAAAALGVAAYALGRRRR